MANHDTLKATIVRALDNDDYVELSTSEVREMMQDLYDGEGEIHDRFASIGGDAPTREAGNKRRAVVVFLDDEY